jgi:hypothetical protein
MNILKEYIWKIKPEDEKKCRQELYNLYQACYVDHLPISTTRYLDREGRKFAINFCEKKYPYEKCKTYLIFQKFKSGYYNK